MSAAALDLPDLHQKSTEAMQRLDDVAVALHTSGISITDPIAQQIDAARLALFQAISALTLERLRQGEQLPFQTPALAPFTPAELAQARAVVEKVPKRPARRKR